MTTHAHTTPDAHNDQSQDPHGARLRNAAQGFSPSQDPRDAASGTFPANTGESQRQAGHRFSATAETHDEDGPGGSPASARLRNAAQGFSDEEPCAADISPPDGECNAPQSDGDYDEGCEMPFDQASEAPDDDEEPPSPAELIGDLMVFQPWAQPLKLSDKQTAALALILKGDRKERIAEKVGVHPGTLWRWTARDPEFRRALSIVRENAFRRTIEELRETVPRAMEVVQRHVTRNNLQAAMHVLRLVHIDRATPPLPVEALLPRPQ